MALVNPEELVGITFDMPDEDGNMQAVTITEAIEEHEKKVFDSSQHMKFRTSRNLDDYEEILTCNEVIDHIKKQGKEPLHWELCHTVSH